MVIILSHVFFAIIGLELNAGVLKRTCVWVESGALRGLCSEDADCGAGQVCGRQISNPF